MGAPGPLIISAPDKYTQVVDLLGGVRYGEFVPAVIQ
jgi:hypothetical protein